MKVTVIVNGRFHAFDLAGQLHLKGNLHKLITSYPAFKAVEWGIPKEKVVSLMPLEIMNRSQKYLTPIKKSVSAWQNMFFDFTAARFIPKDSDLVVAWSGSALRCIERAKSFNIKTVVERGSSHMLEQMKVLDEEYSIHGMKFKGEHKKIINSELREYEAADFISLPSSYTARSFFKNGFDEEKIIQVPYGVNLNSFKQIDKEDDIFRIIHCGGLSIRKGLPYLLQAFHELNLTNSELWLIGSLNPEVKSFLEKYDNGKVFHKGPYPQTELYRYYSQGSLFCLMSVEEGLAMVQPQAMACGLPVICTSHTGGEDIVRDGVDGFVLPIRDVDALKKKILWSYENKDRLKKMGESAKERVKSGYSWDDYGRKIIENYSRILST